LYILAATIAWLVFRKLFYGPLWWFVYLPFKLWYGMSWWVMSSVWGLAVSSKARNGTSVVGVTSAGFGVGSASASVRASMASRGGGGEAVTLARRGNNGDETPMSDVVSKMVEASRAMQDATASVTQEAEPERTSDDAQPLGNQAQQQGQNGPQRQAQANVQRGDGAVLQERKDVPRNPKKRMMEVPMEPPEMERRNEL